MEREQEAAYLGDGAYVTRGADGGVVLTTGTHRERDADDVVVLGPCEMEALLRFVREGREQGGDGATEAR